MGREAAAGTGFLLHPGFLLPAARAGGRGESSEPAARPRRGPVRPGDRRAPAADGPFPVASPPGPEAPPRTRGRAGRAPAPRRGPEAQPGASCRARVAGPKRREAVATLFWQRARGPDAVRAPRVAPNVGSLGGCGWKALRWRWAWPFARAGGAVAPRAPSSLAARAAPFVDALPAEAWGGRGQRGASLGVWECVNGAEAA